MTSVCSGAFLLAEAGLLDGRRATTHWSRCDELAERYPGRDRRARPDLHARRDVFTSAGVTAGMDLALALVSDDLGRDAALTIARYLVLFLQRPGNQAQFSAQLGPQLADRDEVRSLQQWIADHPGADCSVEALARRGRHEPPPPGPRVRRRGGHHPGALRRAGAPRGRPTPARGVRPTPIEQVAASCGFGTTETMRRVFVRHLGVPPAAYRSRFRTPVA